MKSESNGEIINIKSPTRVDLSGGTLDLWPLYMFVGGGTTINVAIDIFTYVQIVPLSTRRILIESRDLQTKIEFSDLESCLSSTENSMALYKGILNYFHSRSDLDERGFHLITKSESPIGGGLGGSSSLTISLMKGFAQFLNCHFASAMQMVNVAHNIEAQLLRTPTGTQDYFPAVTGGLNKIIYNADGFTNELLNVDLTLIHQHFLLVYTGKPHHSGINNFEVLKAAVAGDVSTLEALHELKEISEEMEKVLVRAEWHKLPLLFERESTSRIKVCKAFSSSEIERLAHETKMLGASAYKICGAGGGGCVLIWTDEKQKEKIYSRVKELGFSVLNAAPVGIDGAYARI